MISFMTNYVNKLCTLDVTYFCAGLPNGNAVIDAGDRINSNRQSIIGRIELQPHKLRNDRHSGAYMTWHTVYYTTVVVCTGKGDIQYPFQQTFMHQLVKLVKVLHTTPIRSWSLANDILPLVHFLFQRKKTATIVIWSRLFMHRPLKS